MATTNYYQIVQNATAAGREWAKGLMNADSAAVGYPDAVQTDWAAEAAAEAATDESQPAMTPEEAAEYRAAYIRAAKAELDAALDDAVSRWIAAQEG